MNLSGKIGIEPLRVRYFFRWSFVVCCISTDAMLHVACISEIARTMQVHNLKINCNDGVQLAASLFKAKTAKGAVLIAPATGIKRGFYKSFASHLAGSGYSVLSFDNRGIGDSVNGKINAVDASLINWGKLDMVSSLNKTARSGARSALSPYWAQCRRATHGING